MDIYDYIDEYGKYTFLEKEFNDVDASIFSFLVYANLKYIFKGKSMKISEVGKISKKLYSEKDNNIVAVREGNELISYLKDTKRYMDCILFNFDLRESDDTQFSAISIEYLKDKVFVAFEGTNELFSGWRENLLLSYKFPIKAQVEAVSYLNRNYTFKNKELIIGGHSKGGNLALVGGMFSNYLVNKKIKAIYSFDGPGLLDHEFRSKRFRRVEARYKHIIPDYSVAGLFFNNINSYVVKARVRNIYSHSIMFWVIDDDYTFKKTHLSTYSKELNSLINDWLSKYNVEDRKVFIDNLFKVFKEAHVDSILDLKEHISKVVSLIQEATYMDKKTKKILEEFMTIIVKSYGISSYKEIKSKVKGLFNK